MYGFSKDGLAKLEQLHPRLRAVVVKAMAYQCMDFKVIQTMRTPEEAAQNLKNGTSATTRSKHLRQPDGYAHAIDLAPYPIDWKDAVRFAILMGLMWAAAKELGVKIRMGGNWDGDNSFNDNKPHDPGHFELVQ